MARRPVALVAAIVLFGEAVGIVMLHWILGTVVDNQSMSLAGLDPDAMSLSTRIMGFAFGLYLACCGVLLLRAALKDRAPGRFPRILLIAAAVVHGVLGALCVGLVGWTAFAGLMVVLGLIVFSLVCYPPESDGSAPSDRPAQGAGNGGGAAPAAA
ncbi:hypothetical protein DY218_06795 [Streptomyces triticagri]|uniref:Uncharacterized protein n=1 Tax=Streptomyces triticagri TaxID=2293568 RepID=A0A372MAL2_9ACTN|nr:hypothetical protein [Streptomyces triticagri]RFU87443.1 hypothetical protein DY218_06795 [Streptomyces triticagri]